MRMFSVAPTDGKSSEISAPWSASTSATTQPCSMRVTAPIFSRPDWCMSSGRLPMASPPGRATTAWWHRAVSGPRTQTEARNWRTGSMSAFQEISAGTVIVTLPPSTCASQPSPSSTFTMYLTSEMSGMLCSTVVPSARRAADISLRTLFFAPSTITDPTRRAPPVTRKCSFTPPTLVVRQDQGSAPMRRAALTASYRALADKLISCKGVKHGTFSGTTTGQDLA